MEILILIAPSIGLIILQAMADRADKRERNARPIPKR